VRQQQWRAQRKLVRRASSSPSGEEAASQQFDIDEGKPEKLQAELPDGPREDDVSFCWRRCVVRVRACCGAGERRRRCAAVVFGA
jgi:hypothetical protein